MDIEKISAFLHKLANAKIITLLIILGAAAYFIHKNLDFITEITFKIDHTNGSTNQTQANNDRYGAVINVDTNLIPLQFDIPSYFLITITNSGYANANNLEVLVDIGRSKVTSLDIKPKDRCSISSGNAEKTEPIRVVCKTVSAGESIYIYSLLSEATFRSILVTSPNLPQPVSVKNIQHPLEEHTGFSFSEIIIYLIEGIAVIVVITIGFYLIESLVRLLDRVFRNK